MKSTLRLSLSLGLLLLFLTGTTATSEDAYRFAAEAFQGELDKLRQLVLVDLKKIEDGLEASGAPWTPGRVPVWKPE